MAVINLNYFSPALRRRTDLSVFLPTPRKYEIDAGQDGYFHDGCNYQTLYLLHGTYGDHTEWLRCTSLERYAQERRVAVVMPSCGNAFYMDMRQGEQYERYLLDELPAYLKRMLPISVRREDTFIAGLSMGGYGAMRLGFARPERFAAIASLSGLFSFSMLMKSAVPALDEPWPFEAMLGRATAEEVDASEHNVIVRAKRLLEQHKKLPELFLTAGTEDFLLEENRRGQQALRDIGVSVTYEEHPGTHNWQYWDTHIQRALDWMPIRRDTV